MTVQQSSAAGLASFELYDDFNPYPVSSTSQGTYSPQYFLNLWEPTNFNLDTTQVVPSSSEVLSFQYESTESASSTTVASSALYQSCVGMICTPNPVVGANVDTSSVNWVRMRTPNYSFPMQDTGALDTALEANGGSGTSTSDNSWLIIHVTVLPLYAVQIKQNIAYGPQPYETLDQCTPVNAPPNRPGIVVIHGGLWAGSDKSETQFQTLCNSYAAQGYVVDNINYRLTSPKFGGYQWPTQIGDAQLAVRYMRSTGGQTNLDPTRICAYGWSSGSQLGLLVDELQTIHPSDVASLYPNYSPETSCVADFFGPTDMTRLYTEDPTLDQQYIVPFMDGQTPSSDPGIYTDASPVSYVTAQMGPAIIIQGTNDSEVSPDQATELQSDMQAVGVPNSLINYVGRHAFLDLTQGQADMIREQVDAWLIAQEKP